jgi:FAD/FMN-containing dehydrogenase
MLNRRQFVAGLGACVGTQAFARSTASEGARRLTVNDVHSQLNATQVSGIARPHSIDELQGIIRSSGRSPVCVAGGRHAMGGQQFASEATLIDITDMNHVLAFDDRTGIIEIESGVEWPDLVTDLRGTRWAIRQKQTGADRLTLGGTLSANAHGRGLRFKPIVGDVESFTIVDAGGHLVECSRTKNADLFSLAIGGYGLFGVIASVRLRLAPRQKVQRVVEVQQIDRIKAAFDQRIDDGFLYGDFQFGIDPRSDKFLHDGVFSCYRPVSDDTPMPQTQSELHEDDWRKLLLVAHIDKTQAYDRYVGYYMSTNGNVYWSDEHQLSIYPNDYHRAIDATLHTAPATEIITEIYVPRERLADFMAEAREDFRSNDVNLIYGTVRLIERDDETFLAWAKQSFACVIFNLHTEHTDAGVQHSAGAFRRLIDMAIARNGSYYLTYHRFARRDQVEACYPQFGEFLRRKRHFDPRERFQSEWYRHYRKMFAS